MEIKVDINELCDFMHSKLIIYTGDKEYEGILKFISKFIRCLTFEHVYELTSREYLGTLQFSISDIKKLKVSDPPENFDERNFDSSAKLYQSEFGKYQRVDDSKFIDIPPGEHFVDYLPEHLRNNCPNDFCIIDSMSTCFYKAVKDLSESTDVGVSCHGPKISRSCKLSWVCLSTSRCVFIFDIKSLTEAAFHEGLKKIFEDEEIEKVIHDCREVADCLVNLYHTHLNNVFDTQVADYTINMQMCKSKNIFRYVNSLDSCLHKYLKVPQQFLYNHNKSACIEAEEKFYDQRPPSKDFVNFLLKSSMYLIYLKKEQKNEMMSPFEQAVQLHLNSARSASNYHVRKMLAEGSVAEPSYLLKNIGSIGFCAMPTIEEKKLTEEERKRWYLQVTGLPY